MQVKYKFLILLLIIILPFSVLAEGENPDNQPGDVGMEVDPNTVPNEEMPPEESKENISLDAEVENEEEPPATTTEDESKTITSSDEENVNEAITFVDTNEETDNQSSVPEEVDSPQTTEQWIFIIVALAIITIVFGSIVYVFFIIFRAYSSVLEKTDDNTESVITID